MIPRRGDGVRKERLEERGIEGRRKYEGERIANWIMNTKSVMNFLAPRYGVRTAMLAIPSITAATGLNGKM